MHNILETGDTTTDGSDESGDVTTDTGGSGDVTISTDESGDVTTNTGGSGDVTTSTDGFTDGDFTIDFSGESGSASGDGDSDNGRCSVIFTMVEMWQLLP